MNNTEWNKLLKENSIILEKINDRNYIYWVVVNNKIESGWEYREDATDHLEDLPPGKKGRVYSRIGLKKFNLNPDNDSDWLGSVYEQQTIDESGDWIMLSSLGKDIAMDSFSGDIFNPKFLEFDNIKLLSKDWIKLYKKMNISDKKLATIIVKDNKNNISKNKYAQFIKYFAIDEDK